MLIAANSLQGALKEGAATMLFMDKTVEVDKNAGIFVTLNPAGKGYGGRSKLPDNLKQLFRSIAMSVPDNELIAEVRRARAALGSGRDAGKPPGVFRASLQLEHPLLRIARMACSWRAHGAVLMLACVCVCASQVLLVSEGFRAAKDLARKMVSLFALSRELLSPQQHYDWGLRALKTSLGIAGRELREVREAPPLLRPSRPPRSLLCNNAFSPLLPPAWDAQLRE